MMMRRQREGGRGDGCRRGRGRGQANSRACGSRESGLGSGFWEGEEEDGRW